MIHNKSVVYTSGTFDMLHVNHLRMIEYARGLGDILIVGVNTDELVIANKSEPIIPFHERFELVRALKWPDIVIPQKSLIHTDKVRKLKFDTFVVGDDWDGKYDSLEKLGVSVVYFPYGQGISSTRLKKRVVDRYKVLQHQANTHFDLDAITEP